MPSQADNAAISPESWATIRRLRAHLESEQRHAFVQVLDELGEVACERDEWRSAARRYETELREVMDADPGARYWIAEEALGVSE